MPVDVRDINRKRLALTIEGQLRSGKNHMQIARNGRHFPLRSWAIWRDSVVPKLRLQRQGISFDRPCYIQVDYWPGDKRKRDMPGMADAICHCLERAGIVADDSLLVSWSWACMELDRKNPRAKITITDLPGLVQDSKLEFCQQCGENFDPDKDSYHRENCLEENKP